jgi:hypothetical protein
MSIKGIDGTSPLTEVQILPFMALFLVGVVDGCVALVAAVVVLLEARFTCLGRRQVRLAFRVCLISLSAE